jgi:ABC-type transport system substrate-binding protein
MTFDRMKNGKLGMWRYFRSGMKSVEIIDEYKVKMYVNGSPHALLSVLSAYGWIESPTAIRKYSNKEFGLHPIGTGPFKYVEWVPHQRVVLEANKDYWGGEPKLSKIIFVPVPDPQTRLAMLEAGDLDVLNRAPVTEIERLKANPNIIVQSTASGSMVNFAFNCVKKPFDDKRVRQAIAYAMDLRSIVNVLLFGQVIFAETYAAPNVKYIRKYDIYPYNPEKAKSILAELGWKPGKSGYLEKDGKVFRTALLQPSGRYPMDRQIGEAVQAQLKKVGIDLKIMILESASFIKALYLKREEKMKAEYGIMMASRPMGPDADSAFNANFHSTSRRNKALYVNKALDPLLEAGAKEIDDAKRAAIYKEVQDILHEDLPWIPIFTYVNNVVVRKGVKNVGSPSPFISFQIGVEAQKLP